MSGAKVRPHVPAPKRETRTLSLRVDVEVDIIGRADGHWGQAMKEAIIVASEFSLAKKNLIDARYKAGDILHEEKDRKIRLVGTVMKFGDTESVFEEGEWK